MSSLEQEEPEVAATAVVGTAKLMLAGMVTDEEVWCLSHFHPSRHSLMLTWSPQILSRLILLYFASETADNQELRQCLSYFFPVYCYSNPVNQRRVSNVRIMSFRFPFRTC
jgi:condensin complex subunit 3